MINEDAEDTEVESVLSFLDDITKYDSIAQLFNICRLQNAIDESFNNYPDQKKVLLLYFHNKSCPFSRLFCKCLEKSEVQQILKRSYFLLGWDVENNTYQSALKEALDRNVELSCLKDILSSKKGAVILITPVNDTFNIFFVLKWKTDEGSILSALKETEKCFMEEQQCEREISNDEQTFNSTNYLQLMCNGMGDRDYDSFEYDEHELLEQKIAYAFFGPPKRCDDCVSASSGILNNSCDKCGIYSKKEKEVVRRMREKIVEQSDKISKWKGRVIVSFIYICTEPLPKEKQRRIKKAQEKNLAYDANTDFIPVPIFVLRKCKNSEHPCRIFIDNTGRVYESWTEFITNNNLAQCEMIMPEDGAYKIDENGNILIEKHLSPACGIDKKVLRGTDVASTVAGLASGGTLILAAIPTIVMPPVALAVAGGVGICAGAYSIGRSIGRLVDRGRHQEDLSFLNSEARGAYLNIVAGSLGFVGFGANMAVSQLAARGVNIGASATTTVNVLQFINLGASGVGVVNSGYDIIDQWFREGEPPSAFALLQLSSSLLFFGNAVYNFKSAATIVEEAQANTLQEMSDSLRSNRHRKTFDKLLKETIRQNDGNVVRGSAKVIASMRNIKNQDEVFASLTRSNKLLNENNVRFASENGKICLNGTPIDMVEFTRLTKTEVNSFITTLPNAPEPSQAQVRLLNNQIQQSNISSGVIVMRLMNIAPEMLKMLSANDSSVQDKLINACIVLFRELSKDYNIGILNTLDEIFPNHSYCMQVFDMVLRFFDGMVINVENEYQKWLASRNTQMERNYFVSLSIDKSKRLLEIFRFVTDGYFMAKNLTRHGLEQLLKYFFTWFAKQVDAYDDYRERRERRSAHAREARQKVTCKVCAGYSYSNK